MNPGPAAADRPPLVCSMGVEAEPHSMLGVEIEPGLKLDPGPGRAHWHEALEDRREDQSNLGEREPTTEAVVRPQAEREVRSAPHDLLLLLGLPSLRSKCGGIAPGLGQKWVTQGQVMTMVPAGIW